MMELHQKCGVLNSIVDLFDKSETCQEMEVKLFAKILDQNTKLLHLEGNNKRQQLKKLKRVLAFVLFQQIYMDEMLQTLPTFETVTVQVSGTNTSGSVEIQDGGEIVGVYPVDISSGATPSYPTKVAIVSGETPMVSIEISEAPGEGELVSYNIVLYKTG